MEDGLSFINHLVLDQNKLITLSYLLKNTELSITEAQK